MIKIHKIIPFLSLIFTITLVGNGYAQKFEIYSETQSYGGEQAPKHVVAIWIQTPDTQFIRTVHVWGDTANPVMKIWRTHSGYLDLFWWDLSDPEIDAMSSATFQNHDDPITFEWDFKDTAGNVVPNGTYECWFEFSESDYDWNALIPDEPYYGKVAKASVTIDFEKDTDKKIANGEGDSEIKNFKVTYTPKSLGIIYLPEIKHNGLQYFYDKSKKQVNFTFDEQFNAGQVTLEIMDLKGKKVREIKFNNRKGVWDLTDNTGLLISSGIYLFRIYSKNDLRLNQCNYFTFVR